MKEKEIMVLVEKHNIKKLDKDFKELDNLCFLSKNLYNATMYEVRQHYFKTKKYLSYNEVNKMFTEQNQSDYRALPAKVSKHTQRLVEQDFKSFFALLKKKKENKYDKPVRLPRYAHKTEGRKKVHYEKGALSFAKKGYIKLSKTNIYIKTRYTREEIQYVDIVHKKSYIQLIVGIDKETDKAELAEDRYASIDLGLNNLATVSSNAMKLFIINGKPLKSINQYANKEVAKYKSLLGESQYTSKRIEKIFLKRANKINDYLHKASTYIVNQLVSNKIGNLIIGYNKEWKQDINMGKRNNQNFVNIPFYIFKEMLKYKCQMHGIEVFEQEEAYTSKSSFLSDEKIGKHEKYKGTRIFRGLYKDESGQIINADLNGSLNILRKFLIRKKLWNEDIRLSLIGKCCKSNLEVVSL